MIALDGTGLSPGVARGAAVTMRPAAEPRRRLPEDVGARVAFAGARQRAEAELRGAMAALSEVGGPALQILRAHLALVSDRALVTEVERRIETERLTALEALERTAAALVMRFEALGDPVMRARAGDLRDVCDCIARHLGGAAPAVDPLPDGARVVVATDLTPAQVLTCARARPLAFVLEQGAETSHAAILMRALAVPAVIRVPRATALVRDGDLVLVDGDRGRVLVDADEDTSMALPSDMPVAARDPDSRPATTRDGTVVAVTASIAGLADAHRAEAAGADGVGLFRTEGLFLASEHLPSEDVQCASYSAVFAAVGRGHLTVRVLDLGADKQPTGLQLPPEPNPALGLRGLRLAFAYPDLLTTQLRALLRASEGRRLRLLLPMVVDVTDVDRAREMIDAAAQAAHAAPTVDIGVMIETPAAALMAEELSAAADFLSIGTNDLTQYVLAADRGNRDLAASYQPLHPAVLRLVRAVVRAAERQHTPVAACGELAADPRAVPVLLGMGVTELSVRPSAVPGVKAQVRRLSASAARALAEEVAALPTAAAVAERIDRAHEIEIGIDVRETRHSR